MTSQPGEQTISIHILPNISRRKWAMNSQTMNFGQLIECNSKSFDQVVMMGKSASAVLLFRGIPAAQFSWLTETSPEWRYLSIAL